MRRVGVRTVLVGLQPFLFATLLVGCSDDGSVLSNGAAGSSSVGLAPGGSAPVPSPAGGQNMGGAGSGGNTVGVGGTTAAAGATTSGGSGAGQGGMAPQNVVF